MAFFFDNDPEYIRLQLKRIRLAFLPALVFIVCVWLCFAADSLLFNGKSYLALGVYPLEFKGLAGIFTSPFLHASLKHLVSNTLPLLALIWMLFYFYSPIAFKAFVVLWFLSGLFTWIIGRSSYHIGASGVVFALIFFLFFSGIFRRYTPLAAVSLVVAFLYGSMLWSIFPISEYIDVSISWEGHLASAVSGLLVALCFRKSAPQKPQADWEEEEDEFFDDVFWE